MLQTFSPKPFIIRICESTPKLLGISAFIFMTLLQIVILSFHSIFAIAIHKKNKPKTRNQTLRYFTNRYPFYTQHISEHGSSHSDDFCKIDTLKILTEVHFLIMLFVEGLKSYSK